MADRTRRVAPGASADVTPGVAAGATSGVTADVTSGATPARTPQQTAEAVREGMFANDRACQALGIVVLGVGPGTASVQMTVRADMLNGHAICHGGLIATLADSAFAYACNSHGELTVASGFSIDFIAPARAGDVLIARSDEVATAGRTGVYDAVVMNQRGERIAVFRGRSHTMRGKPAVALAPAVTAAATFAASGPVAEASSDPRDPTAPDAA